MSLSAENPLFILEMANNHMGSSDHGIRIIREMHAATKDFSFQKAFKFQYRDLDTFIHPAYQSRNDIKYVKRFSETRLSEEQFQIMKTEMDRLGFLSICTPFDEQSVQKIEQQGFNILKIASCSFTDWPLLERVVRSHLPVIASTAGATLEDIDRVVSFFQHRDRRLSLMHCVGEYPTNPQHMQLNQIDLLAARYPQIPIGFSTHEDPENRDAVRIAVAKGAAIFEKHVGVPTEEFALNAYSANPDQVRQWMAAAQDALVMCGCRDGRKEFPPEEISTLRALRRGAFARHPIAQGEKIAMSDLFLAIPVLGDQVTANDLSKYTDYFAERDFAANEPIFFSQVRQYETREKVYEIVQKVKALLEESRVVTPGRADLEISHHYGIERFYQVGTTMITVVNRDYCKKLIMVLAGQSHPEQYHKVKEETFYILYGDVTISVDGEERKYSRGNVVVIKPGVRHAFSSTTGAVIEEISSTHNADDSFYADPMIALNRNRKTLLTYWMG